MTNEFYETFKDYQKDELINIVLSPEEYQPKAIHAAQKIITEKKWTADLNKKIEEKNIKEKEEEELYKEEIEEKAEYYKNAVEFKKQGYSFQIRIADIPKFEGSLAENNIDFFREDKNIGVQLDSYPTQTYFFKNKDIESVDKIGINLKLTTAPYSDIKPFFSFEIKVLLFVIVISILAILIFK